ncbi:MAG: hypothetical protein DMG06_19520 [Acidobacteria bacterium]|nr:MAG: hypothetical protein DMG06_19520 [Acidobacteriota bacterium]
MGSTQSDSFPKMQQELFQPYRRLIEIQIEDQSHRVPDNNMVLRCFQYICLEDISCGRFCWNQECKTCMIGYELKSGEKKNTLSCQTMVSEGMKITKISKELRWALRSILPAAAENLS